MIINNFGPWCLWIRLYLYHSKLDYSQQTTIQNCHSLEITYNPLKDLIQPFLNLFFQAEEITIDMESV